MASRFNRPEESETVQIINTLFNGVAQVLNVLSKDKDNNPTDPVAEWPQSELSQELQENVLRNSLLDPLLRRNGPKIPNLPKINVEVE